jgi:hypothetical protein
MSKAMVSFFDQFPLYNGVKISIRGTDGYFSATDMSKAMGKRFRNWTRTKFAQELLDELSKINGIPIDYDNCRSQTQTPLIDYVRGGQGGIFVHSSVAEEYAKFLMRSRSMSTQVYLIHALGTVFYKIGMASDTSSRLSILQIGCPFELVVIWSKEFSDAEKIETFLHSTFKNCRVRGEWFKLNSEDLKVVKGLLK